ncbi:uncharacterized protein LOC112567762 isoform X1 [Pomacea canaliculata]|uniref:uncharacterized protein LOC112567762 isoform X1 n=1 Tax=Pomacea canaliculata TaxID=400727 RepID=UPI000D73B1A9|nr:uncharacterized protein LOC112567762 isoform X1 [Pomacea canaliculata]
MLGNICVLLILLVLIHTGFSVRIEQCNDGQITVVEESTSIITCSGIRKDRDVVWWYKLPNGDYTYIGTCRTDNSCTNNFRLKRKGENSSLIPTRTDAGITVACQQNNLVLPNEYHECVISLKSQVALSNCHVTTNVSSWSLRGSCFLHKMFSSLGEYDCFWVLGQAAFSEFVISELQPYTDNSTGLAYYQGNCSFTSSLPSGKGTYTYYIVSKPELADNYSYQLVISSPGPLDISSCPAFVPENASVICKCGANPPGSPPAVVTWEGHNDSATLELLHVHRADNGRTFICHLTWRTSQSAEFKLRVAYGPDRAEISESTFKTGAGDTVTNLTCKASDYFPDVLYTWSIPCHMEVRVDKASVCSMTFQTPETEVTCTAVNTQFSTLKAVAVMTFYGEGSPQESKVTAFLLPLIGGILGILTIVSIIAGLAVCIKRRKESKVTSGFTDYTNETYITSAEVSSVVLTNLPEDEGSKNTGDIGTKPAFRTSNLKQAQDVGTARTREHGDTSSDLYAVPDKSAKLKQKRDSRQCKESRASAMTEKPKSMCVSEDTGNTKQIFDDSGKFYHSGSEGLYENVATRKTERSAESVDSRKHTSSRKLQEENPAQLQNDDVLYNRLCFSSKTHSVTLTSPSESVYNCLDHQ